MPRLAAVFFLLLISLALPITNGLSPSRKLEEIIQNKCAECQLPPPPPPIPECPPLPPSPPPPSPPPPPPPKPECPPLPPPSPPPLLPSPPPLLPPPPPLLPPPVLPPPPPPVFCPPPQKSPGGQALYITGPDGGLYPVSHPFSGVETRFTMGLPLLVAGVLLFLGLFITN